jgi:DNA replication and repair protein RecF
VYRPNTKARDLAKAFQQSFSDDVERGHTTKGVHRDEIDIFYEGQLARDFASQGQQRSITLALKLAELDALTKSTGKVPLLLLDDVSSELDYQRNERLFVLLAELGGQVFLSTTHPEFIRVGAQRTDFNVNAGVIENEIRTQPIASQAIIHRQR